MDTKSEDKIVRQIEKSLSNNMNENLFLTSEHTNSVVVTKEEGKKELEDPDYPLFSYDKINDSQITMSRAEYIRQAREACLRQLSNSQVYSRAYDVNYMEAEAVIADQPLTNKKEKAWKLFSDEPRTDSMEEDTPGEIASFRSLIIRTVCAVVLFISVFVIDKFELSIGKLTHTMIQEYVTGNDSLQVLENFIVTWLK